MEAGQTFGNLTAIEFSRRDHNRKTWWLFRCECGNVKPIRIDHVKSGRATTCGECLTAVGNRRVENKGYIVLGIDPNDPLASMARERVNNGCLYVFEHRYVMAQYLNRPLYTWETVHHINGNRADNRIENLQLRIGKHGAGQAYHCLDCGSRRIAPTQLAD